MYQAPCINNSNLPAPYSPSKSIRHPIIIDPTLCTRKRRSFEERLSICKRDAIFRLNEFQQGPEDNDECIRRCQWDRALVSPRARPGSAYGVSLRRTDATQIPVFYIYNQY